MLDAWPSACAMRILVKAMTEPTERAIPPEMITKVAPTAATPMNALSPKRLTSTRSDPKFGKKTQPAT